MKSWTTPEPPTLHAHLALILHDLRAVVAPHAFSHPILGPLLTLVWRYLSRPAQRLERLIARWQSGRLVAPRARPPGGAPGDTARKQREAKPRLPSGHAWLVRMLQRTAQFSGQLEALVARPEMAELLAAAPQAGRILRPLFTMLGVRPFPAVLRRPGAKPPPPGPILSRPSRRPPWLSPQPAAVGPSGPATVPLRFAPR